MQVRRLALPDNCSGKCGNILFEACRRYGMPAEFLRQVCGSTESYLLKPVGDMVCPQSF